jgi:uncharacterized protein
VGVSLDGPEHLHNTNRVYSSGDGSFLNVRKGIRLLQKHEIPFGVLMVVGKEAMDLDPEEVFRFFLEELDIKNFAFLPVRPDNFPGLGEIPTTDYLTSGDYSAFMKSIFDLWYDLDDPTIQIREFKSILGTLFEAEACLCIFAGNCLGNNFAIEANGEVSHCDKFQGDPEYYLGNIAELTFPEIRRTKRFHTLAVKEKKELEAIRSCSWFKYCNGGCPHDSYIARKITPEYGDTCCGYGDLIEHIYTRVSNTLNQALLDPRQHANGLLVR